MTAADAARGVTMGTCDETGGAAEVFDLMEELRRQLLDWLETREYRQDTVMVESYRLSGLRLGQSRLANLSFVVNCR